MKIAHRKIGKDHPPFIIAEMSCNHLGDLDRAIEIIQVAKDCGADAIKFQTYTADTMTIDSENSDFVINDGLWNGRKLYDLYTEAHTPWDWHQVLFEKAKELEIIAFSSPFDSTAIALLETLNCSAYKIASFEATDLTLIKKAAQTSKPLIISTGMANLSEIEEAVDAAYEAGCAQLALMHCISGYPTPITESNLVTISDLKKHFNIVVGLSDHTIGITTAISAVALGANIIEKHLTLSRAEGGLDTKFSLEPVEFKKMCDTCKDSWHALGKVDYTQKDSEIENTIFRRSLYVVADIKKGEKFSTENIRSIRPGYGLLPKYLDQVLGSTALLDIKRGTALSKKMVDGIE